MCTLCVLYNCLYVGFHCEIHENYAFVQSSSEENGGFGLNMLLAGEYQFKLQCPAGMWCFSVCIAVENV